MSFSWHCEYFPLFARFQKALEGSFNPIYKDNDKELIERVRARLGQMTGRQLRRPGLIEYDACNVIRGGTMTTQTNNRFMLVGFVLAAVGGIGTAMSFALGYDIGAAKYLVTPLTLIGIGMMVAAKFTPVQD